MTGFRLAGAGNDEDYETIYATHPALPGTSIVYIEDGAIMARETVVLWGLVADGTPVPITMSGVWDGTQQENRFVSFADGSCAKYEQSWPTLEEAVLDFARKDKERLASATDL